MARPAAGVTDGVTVTSAADLLAGLDPEQQAVVEAVRGPVCVLAGAGTGKTRAITARVAFAVLTTASALIGAAPAVFAGRMASVGVTTSEPSMLPELDIKKR